LEKVDELIDDIKIQNQIMVVGFAAVVASLKDTNALLKDLVDVITKLPESIVNQLKVQQIYDDISWMESKLTQAQFLNVGSLAEKKAFVKSIVFSEVALKERLIRVSDYQLDLVENIPDTSFFLPGKIIANNVVYSSREIKKVAIYLFVYAEKVSKDFENSEEYQGLSYSGLSLVASLQKSIRSREQRKFNAFGGHLNFSYKLDATRMSPTSIYTERNNVSLKATSTDDKVEFESLEADVILDGTYWFNGNSWYFDIVKDRGDGYFNMRSVSFSACGPLCLVGSMPSLRGNPDKEQIVNVNLLRDPKDMNNRVVIVNDNNQVLSSNGKSLLFDGDFRDEKKSARRALVLYLRLNALMF